MDIMCSGLNWEQALYGYYVFRIQLELSIIWILCVQDWTGSIAVYGYYVFSIELEVQKYMDIMCSGLDWEQALYGYYVFRIGLGVGIIWMEKEPQNVFNTGGTICR